MTDNVITDFPIQVKLVTDNMSDTEMLLQARLQATKRMNRVSRGQPLTEREIGQIEFINDCLTKCGYAPVSLGFRES